MSFYTFPEIHRLGHQAVAEADNHVEDGDTAPLMLLEKHLLGTVPVSVDVFLIIGPADDLLVLGLVRLLALQGLKVSIQRCSEANFSEEGCTAPAIKQMLEQISLSRLVIFVPVSEQRMPRWLAWLLGFAEAKKEGGIGILPLLSSIAEQPVVDSIYAFYPLIIHIDPSDEMAVGSIYSHCELVCLSEFLVMPNSWRFAC